MSAARQPWSQLAARVRPRPARPAATPPAPRPAAPAGPAGRRSLAALFAAPPEPEAVPRPAAADPTPATPTAVA